MWPGSALFGHSHVQGMQPHLSFIGWNTPGTWFLAAAEPGWRCSHTAGICSGSLPLTSHSHSPACLDRPARPRHNGNHLQEEPSRALRLLPGAPHTNPTEGRDRVSGEAEVLGSIKEALGGSFEEALPTQKGTWSCATTSLQFESNVWMGNTPTALLCSSPSCLQVWSGFPRGETPMKTIPGLFAGTQQHCEQSPPRLIR